MAAVALVLAAAGEAIASLPGAVCMRKLGKCCCIQPLTDVDDFTTSPTFELVDGIPTILAPNAINPSNTGSVRYRNTLTGSANNRTKPGPDPNALPTM